ncbi:unnamed protein product [Closterium sp. NIES-64]|nr:unnamed protein product [Closterium sp. NIES-64]
MARNMGIPPTFRCSIGWVRRALRRQGVRCRAAQGEAASADMAAVRDAREKLPQLLTHLGVTPRDTFNIDETALWLSVLPRRTYSNGRIPGRKLSKERLTVAFLVNADGSHVFRPLVITQCCHVRRKSQDFGAARQREQPHAPLTARVERDRLRDPDDLHEQLAARFLAAEYHRLHTTARSGHHSHRKSPLPTALVAGLHGLVERRGRDYRRRPVPPQFAWLSDAWMSVGERTIQRCWWRTGCLPLSWSLELSHVHDDEPTPAVYPDIELDDDIDDVGTLISRLALGNAAMTAAEYVAIDDGEPTSAEGAEGQPTNEPESGVDAELWQAPTTIPAVYYDADPVCREARRTARAACEMLIGYARATRITPRDLCHLFDIRNPFIIARMERASPSLNLNVAPQPVPSPGATPTPETPRPRGRVLPDWMTRPSRRQELFDAGVGAVMGGYVDAAEWMRM